MNLLQNSNLSHYIHVYAKIHNYIGYLHYRDSFSGNEQKVLPCTKFSELVYNTLLIHVWSRIYVYTAHRNNIERYFYLCCYVLFQLIFFILKKLWIMLAAVLHFTLLANVSIYAMIIIGTIFFKKLWFQILFVVWGTFLF